MDGKFNFTGFNSVLSDFGHSEISAKPAAGSAGVKEEAFRKPKKSKVQKYKVKTNGKNKFPAFALLSCCAACFCFAFIFETVGAGQEGRNSVIGAMRSVLNDETQNEDETKDLGKLKLVELPSILEIFTRSDRPAMPVAAENVAVDEESLIAKIYAPAGTEISSVLEGTVKAVNPASERGGLVIVSHPNDIEIYYYGLSEISVERGQPVLQGSLIGKLGSDILYLKITKRGEPVDPFEFLGLKARLG